MSLLLSLLLDELGVLLLLDDVPVLGAVVHLLFRQDVQREEVDEDGGEAEQRRKRAARFEAAAARPPPPPPQRSFAWSGGKMSTNREEATEAFLERVSRGETAELSAEQRAAIARVADS